jgi:hypothetical protein
VIKNPDQQQAADTLAIINSNIIKLMKHLKKKYNTSNENVNLLLKRFNPDNIREHKPDYINPEVAYTLFKGETLAICIRDYYNTGSIINDINVIMFVAIHEIGHIATNFNQHPIGFWTAFAFLLKEAVEAGVYTGEYYSLLPKKYCKNMVINYNPLYDNRFN